MKSILPALLSVAMFSPMMATPYEQSGSGGKRPQSTKTKAQRKARIAKKKARKKHG